MPSENDGFNNKVYHTYFLSKNTKCLTTFSHDFDVGAVRRGAKLADLEKMQC
jgi:hypothetical protein